MRVCVVRLNPEVLGVHVLRIRVIGVALRGVVGDVGAAPNQRSAEAAAKLELEVITATPQT